MTHFLSKLRLHWGVYQATISEQFSPVINFNLPQACIRYEHPLCHFASARLWTDTISLVWVNTSITSQPPPQPEAKLALCTRQTRATCPMARAFSVAWALHRHVWTRWTISCDPVRMLIRRIWRYKSYKFTTNTERVHQPLNKVHIAQNTVAVFDLHLTDIIT